MQWYAEIRDKYFTLKPLIIIATKSDQVKSQTRYDPSFVRHQECLDFAQRVDAAKFIDVRVPDHVCFYLCVHECIAVSAQPANRRISRVHRRISCSARRWKRSRSSALRRCRSSRVTSV